MSQEFQIAGRSWTLGEQIGAGGFGRVHAAQSRADKAVIKLVPKVAGAQRELLFAGDIRSLHGVVPIWGYAETDEEFAILMPRAAQTLRQHVLVNAPLEYPAALALLAELAQALVGLAQRGIVHRDIKPENILLLDDVWCLADFGVSRYADSTTTTQTHKGRTSRPYAAPEQWLEERLTSAADVYALGVIAHELLTGRRPFPGPEASDYRHQHLIDQPPQLQNVPPLFAKLVLRCLAKSAGSRPAPAELLDQLRRAETRHAAPTPGIAALQAATHAAAEEDSAQDRRHMHQRAELVRRAGLAMDGAQQFWDIRDEIISALCLEGGLQGEASNGNHTDRVFKVRQGWFRFSGLQVGRGRRDDEWKYLDDWYHLTPKTSFENFDRGIADRNEAVRCLRTSNSRLPFDCVLAAEMKVAFGRFGSRTFSRGHSLWYCDALVEGEYRWFELAFLDAVRLLDPEYARYHLDANRSKALELPSAAGPSISAEAFGPYSQCSKIGTLLAWWQPVPLILGELDEVIDRWANWLALGSRGQLRPPNFPRENPWLLPEDELNEFLAGER